MKRWGKISITEYIIGGVLIASAIVGRYWLINNQLKREDGIIPRDYRNQKIELASEAKDRTTDPTQSIKEYVKQQIILLEKNNRLVDIYNSIDLSKISDEEKEWFKYTDRKELVSLMRKDLAEETVKTIDDICGLKKLSKKDCIFIDRILEPIVTEFYEKMDIFEMQR